MRAIGAISIALKFVDQLAAEVVHDHRPCLYRYLDWTRRVKDFEGAYLRQGTPRRVARMPVDGGELEWLTQSSLRPSRIR